MLDSSSTQQPDRYFCLCEQSSHEVDSSCDPKAVVASVRENVLQNHSGNIEKVHKSATALLEAALRTNPQEEVTITIKTHDSELRGQEETAIIRDTKNTRPLSYLQGNLFTKLLTRSIITRR